MDEAQFARQREDLVHSLSRDITDERVLAAITRVPRERFVTPEMAHLAYQDRPLPIGYGQTISQPMMVAIMLQELRLTGREKVLEVGAGSGYQAALLAELAGEVITVELVPDLAVLAAETLAANGYESVRVHQAGDVLGWPPDAPYVAIIVAAASPRIPQSLADQLAPGGRLVIPVGTSDGQDLMLVERRPEGLTVSRKGACRFVPLLGKGAFSASLGASNSS